MKALPALVLVVSLPLLLPPAAQAGEAQAPVFSRHDTNRDGYLDGREYYRLRQRVRARRGHAYRGGGLHDFEHIDSDADGRVSREEILRRIDAAQD
jgi:hypothetical protein